MINHADTCKDKDNSNLSLHQTEYVSYPVGSVNLELNLVTVDWDKAEYLDSGDGFVICDTCMRDTGNFMAE